MGLLAEPMLPLLHHVTCAFTKIASHGQIGLACCAANRSHASHAPLCKDSLPREVRAGSYWAIWAFDPSCR